MNRIKYFSVIVLCAAALLSASCILFEQDQNMDGKWFFATNIQTHYSGSTDVYAYDETTHNASRYVISGNTARLEFYNGSTGAWEYREFPFMFYYLRPDYTLTNITNTLVFRAYTETNSYYDAGTNYSSYKTEMLLTTVYSRPGRDVIRLAVLETRLTAIQSYITNGFISSCSTNGELVTFSSSNSNIIILTRMSE